MTDSDDIDLLLNEFYQISDESSTVISSSQPPLSTQPFTLDPLLSHLNPMTYLPGYASVHPPSTYPSPEELNLDSSQFSLEGFVEKFVLPKTYDGITQLDAQLKSEVHVQDLNMQAIVKENYRKFISATSTVKELRVDVEKTEATKKELFLLIEKIDTKATKISNNLLPHKSKIEELVSIKMLLKKVEFLFELPARLHKAWELGDYAQAVKVYQIAQNILQSHTHISSIKSFQAVLAESELIMAQLTLTLKGNLKDPKMGSIMILESATLLIQRGQSLNDLWPDMLESRKTKFLANIQKAFSAFNVQNRATRAASLPKLDGASVVGVNENGRSLLVGLVYEYFVIEFFEFLEHFGRMFLNDPSCIQGQIRNEVNKFVRILFAEYLSAVSLGLRSSAQSALTSKQKEPFGGFMEDLSFFLEHMDKLSKIVPDTRVSDKASEMIQKSLREAVEWFFEKTQEEIALILVRLNERVCELETSLFDSAKPTTEQSELEQIQRIRQDYAIAPCNNIILSINAALTMLLPLLDLNGISDETSWLSPLIHEHFRITMFSMTCLVLQDTIRLSEGYVHSVRSVLTSKASQIFSHVLSKPCSLYYLVLSQLFLYMNEKGVETCLAFLHDSFHFDDEDKEETDRLQMRQDTKECAQLLLRKYAEVHGYKLANDLTNRWNMINWATTSPPSSIHPSVNEFWRAMNLLEIELSMFFRKSDLKQIKSEFDAASVVNAVFRKRVQVVGPLAWNRTAPLSAVFKMVFKALIEQARTITFSLQGLAQYHLNVLALTLLLPQSLSLDEKRSLHALLEDMLKSSSLRCITFDQGGIKLLGTNIKCTNNGAVYEP